VNDGVVTFEGVVLDPLQIEAFEVAAENIPGVKKVNDRIALDGSPSLGKPRHETQSVFRSAIVVQ